MACRLPSVEVDKGVAESIFTSPSISTERRRRGRRAGMSKKGEAASLAASSDTLALWEKFLNAWLLPRWVSSVWGDGNSGTIYFAAAAA
jgi:hypothetical protein